MIEREGRGGKVRRHFVILICVLFFWMVVLNSRSSVFVPAN